MKTNNELFEAIKFLKNYKKHFQLDEDDVQEILIKFHTSYNKELGAVSTFLATVITNYNATKWRSAGCAKHAHTAIQIDKVTQEDDREWLMAQIASNDAEIEVYDDIDRFKGLITLGMSCLTKKKREIIQLYYFDEMTLYEVAKHLGTSHQNIHIHLQAAVAKMKLFFKKNDITCNF
jgi:RNA polymerase sigma factor (sigma-70 family)